MRDEVLKTGDIYELRSAITEVGYSPVAKGDIKTISAILYTDLDGGWRYNSYPIDQQHALYIMQGVARAWLLDIGWSYQEPSEWHSVGWVDPDSKVEIFYLSEALLYAKEHSNA